MTKVSTPDAFTRLAKQGETPIICEGEVAKRVGEAINKMTKCMEQAGWTRWIGTATLLASGAGGPMGILVGGSASAVPGIKIRSDWQAAERLPLGQACAILVQNGYRITVNDGLQLIIAQVATPDKFRPGPMNFLDRGVPPLSEILVSGTAV